MFHWVLFSEQTYTFTGLYKYTKFQILDGPDMYPWKTIIKIDRKLRTSVYLQIVNHLIAEITQGRISPGSKLPATRILADLLKINRKTVVLAYDELMAQGWISIKASKGTFVSELLPMIKSRGLKQNYKSTSSSKTSYSIGDEQKLKRHNIAKGLAIDGGVPDVRLAPIDILYKNCRSIATSRVGQKLLKYGDEKGAYVLREALAKYLQMTRGLKCKTENIFITRGSQMAIYLVFNLLLKENDNVIVGNTNYPDANRVIENTGAIMRTVPVDDEGIDVAAVERLCEQYSIRAMYITSHHHYPTTVTLSAERRLRLLQLAAQYKFAIIEDDYDYDFHYAHSSILPLASIDTNGSVVYIGSFTKSLAPAIRVGYLVAPQNLIDALIKSRKTIDRQGDSILEAAIAQMLTEGEIQRHLKKSLNIYRIRRDFFCKLLKEELGDLIYFEIPDGGMAIWARFDMNINLKQLLEAVKVRKLYILSDQSFVKDLNSIRLGFSQLNENEMIMVVNIMKEEISKLLLFAKP